PARIVSTRTTGIRMVTSPARVYRVCPPFAIPARTPMVFGRNVEQNGSEKSEFERRSARGRGPLHGQRQPLTVFGRWVFSGCGRRPGRFFFVGCRLLPLVAGRLAGLLRSLQFLQLLGHPLGGARID